MVKRLIAAALLAVANIAGVTNAGPASDVDDDDSVGGIECVDCTSDSKKADKQSGTLAAASAAVLEPLDIAWIVRDADGGASAAAVVRRQDDHVAVISLATESPDATWSDLLARAFTFCRDQDALKVIIEAADLPPKAIQSIAESSGFQPSKTQWLDSVSVIECYTNLYWRPGSTEGSLSRRDDRVT